MKQELHALRSQAECWLTLLFHVGKNATNMKAHRKWWGSCPLDIDNQPPIRQCTANLEADMGEKSSCLTPTPASASTSSGAAREPEMKTCYRCTPDSQFFAIVA